MMPRTRIGAGRALGVAHLLAGEAPPAVGDVLALGPVSRDDWMGVRVERVRGRTVWYESVSIGRAHLGAERWEFVPPARRLAPERLGRRR